MWPDCPNERYVIVFVGYYVAMAQPLGIEALEGALSDLGELLAESGTSADLFVIGGAAYLLADPHSAPPTRDVDAVARLDGHELVQPVLLPQVIEAIEAIGRIHQLGPGWLNAAAANAFGDLVPEGALDRADVRTWGSLTLRIAHRTDLIRLKLQAATRRGPKGERHRQNLVSLRPTEEELDDAATWYRNAASDPRAVEERLGEVVARIREALDGTR